MNGRAHHGRPARVAWPELRVVGLLLAGALGVHRLRYEMTFGHDAQTTLAEHGHGYLSLVAPAVGVLVAAVLARLLVRAAGVVPTQQPPSRRFARLWLGAAIALLTIYSAQELLEGALAPGHPAGWDALLPDGGWTAAPLSALFGAVGALTLRGARHLEAHGLPCFTITRTLVGLPPTRLTRCSLLGWRASAAVLVRHAGRAPPRRLV